MNIYQTAQGVFEQTFRPLVPYTPYGKWITRPDGSKHYRKHSTGNMRYKATKFEHITDTHFRAYVDGDIATYVPYTNEPWISPKWRGAKNPNEGWIPRAVMAYAEALATALGGKVVISEEIK